jgi:hypothetical protein
MTRSTLSRRTMLRSAIAGGVGISLFSPELLSQAFATAQQAASEEPIPRIPFYPARTALAGVPWRGPAPLGENSSARMTWSVRVGPAGLHIDERTGAPSWDNPKEGRHVIEQDVVCVGRKSSIEWPLHVVSTDFPTSVLLTGRYVDFILRPEDAAWFQRNNAVQLADGVLARLANLFGFSPVVDRQIAKYTTTFAGALSGNPIQFGSAALSTDPVKGWCLGAFNHEIAHNFVCRNHLNLILADNWIAKSVSRVLCSCSDSFGAAHTGTPGRFWSIRAAIGEL